MNHSTTRRAQRLGSASGAISIVLYFVSTAILVGSITQSDSLSKARRIFNDQADSLDVGSALLTLSIPFLLFFAVTLYSVLAASEGGDRRWTVLSIVGATGGGAGLLAGSAASPIVRPLALLANLAMWLYFLIGSIPVWRAAAAAGSESSASRTVSAMAPGS